MKEANKNCINCAHCKRVKRKGQIEYICEYETYGMALPYVGVLAHKCEKWEEDRWMN